MFGCCFDQIIRPLHPLKPEIANLKLPTYLGPLPLNLDRNTLAEEERGVSGGEVWVLKQDPLLQTFLPQLLKRLPVRLRVLGLAGQSGLDGHLIGEGEGA